MAQRAYVGGDRPAPGGYVVTYRWDNLQGTTSDVGEPILIATLQDKCVHFFGIALGTFVLEGTNAEPAENQWVTLLNSFEAPIDETHARHLHQVHDDPLWIRPRVGGGATAVSCILVARRPYQ